MLRWLGVFMGSAFAALVAARYVQGPLWIDFLWLFAGCTGVASALLVGLLVRRVGGGAGSWVSPRPSGDRSSEWAAWAALALSLGASAGRARLVQRILEEPARRITIDLGDVLLAAGTVTWGLLALLWGVYALSALVGRPSGEALAKAPAVASVAAVIGALYCIAPLWRLLGLGVDHFTILGLFGLAAVAYGVQAAYRRVTRPRDDRPWG